LQILPSDGAIAASNNFSYSQDGWKSCHAWWVFLLLGVGYFSVGWHKFDWLWKDGEAKTHLAIWKIPILSSSDIGIDSIAYVKFLICC
jgi:hypothetical protein